MSNEDIKFVFNFEGKKRKEYSIYEFDHFEDLVEAIKEDLNLSKETNLVFNYPKEFNFSNIDMRINYFMDEESFEYFKEIIQEIQNKQIPNKAFNNKTINYNKVDQLPKGLPTLKKKLTEYLKGGLDTALKKMIPIFKKEKIKNEKNWYSKGKLKQKNIICNNCYKNNIIGFRFICSECDRFNLCEACESLRIQSQIEHEPSHFFIQISSLVNEDILLYNNIIERKNQHIKINLDEIKDKNIQTETYVIIHNTGENSFKNCILFPICYGGKYILGDKIDIKDDIKKNDSIKINIKLKGFENSGISKWRMLTKNGIPFGEVINLEVIVELKTQ